VRVTALFRCAPQGLLPAGCCHQPQGGAPVDPNVGQAIHPTLYNMLLPLRAGGAHYRPINWQDFRMKRFAGDYADVGEEVQIDHYRL